MAFVIIATMKFMTQWLPVLAVAVGFGIATTAETQTQETQVPAQQLDPLDQVPTYRSGVTLVTTDVIVRDGDGQFLADLTTGDFKVYEDDNLQEIASLVLVHGGRVYNQLLPPPPVQEGIVLPPSRPVNDTAGRIFVFFVDDLHLQTAHTPKVRQVFKKMTDTLVHDGDMFAIVTTGPSSIAIDMTYDRAMLDVAYNRITGEGFSPRELINSVMEGADGPAEIRWRAHTAFKVAKDIVVNLEKVQNRRKAFVYMSSGYDFNPFDEERAFARNPMAREARDLQEMGLLSDQDFAEMYDGVTDPLVDPIARIERMGSVFADSDLSMELAELVKAANRANASFYTVDPRGLVAGPDIDYDLPRDEWQDYMFKTQSSLRMLAELTGGIAVVNRNDFENAFRQVDAETSDYYVLGFYSSNPDPTYRTRRLSVEVDREDVNVRARTHYTYERESTQ